MALQPAHLVKQGKKDAIEAVRRVTSQFRAQTVRHHNPLGLPQGKEGRLLKLRVVLLPGTEERERHIWCIALCTYVANQPELTLAFSGLSHVHQVLVLLLTEPREDQPHAVKEGFLQATGPQWHAAWQAAIGKDGAWDNLQT